MKKNVVLFTLTLAVTALAGAQSFSKTYKPDLPVAYFSMLGMEAPIAKNLFASANLKTVTGENGTMKATIESTNNTGGVFNGSLLLTANNKKIMRMKLSLQSDLDGDFNYITYLAFTDITTGASQELRWDGTQRKSGQMIGAFLELLDYFYDKDKLFGKVK